MESLGKVRQWLKTAAGVIGAILLAVLTFGLYGRRQRRLGLALAEAENTFKKEADSIASASDRLDKESEEVAGAEATELFARRKAQWKDKTQL